MLEAQKFELYQRPESLRSDKISIVSKPPDPIVLTKRSKTEVMSDSISNGTAGAKNRIVDKISTT